MQIYNACIFVASNNNNNCYFLFHKKMREHMSFASIINEFLSLLYSFNYLFCIFLLLFEIFFSCSFKYRYLIYLFLASFLRVFI